MFRNRVLYAAAAILTLATANYLGAGLASASTIVYSSFDPGDAYDQTSGWTIGGTLVAVQGLQFVPTGTGAIQTIEIAAFRLAGGSAVNISLMTNVADRPGLVLESMPICCFGDAPSIHLASSVLRPVLTSGTKYWLVVSPIAAGDLFGWSRNLNPPFALNVQQQMGGPWVAGDGWRGTLRIRSDAPTPTRTSTWGRLKSHFR